jgi:hypothetical protein
MQTPVEQGAAIVVAAPVLALLFTAWPFALSFVASCVALIYVASTNINVAVKNIIGSTLIGGAMSQLTAIPVLLIVKHNFPHLLTWAETAQAPMTALLAIVIGLLTQKLMPKIINRLGREIDGGNFNDTNSTN